MLRLHAAALTHQGRVRRRNEDTIAVGSWWRSGSMAAPEVIEAEVRAPLMALVADGMGGHAAGEVASRDAVQFLIERVARAVDEASIAGLLRGASQALFEQMLEQPTCRGMGTTIVGLAITAARVIAFNIGDSRVYRLDGGRLTQLSTDDTPGPKLEDGRTARYTSNLITQTLGGDVAMEPLDPHVLGGPARAGARYLLCSDGVSDLLAKHEIEARIEDDAVATVQALFDVAMARGGRDNISLILVRLEEENAAC